MKRSKMTQVGVSIGLMTLLLGGCSTSEVTADVEQAVEAIEEVAQEETFELLTQTLSLNELSSLQVTNRYDVYNESTEKVETNYGLTGSMSSASVLDAFKENLNGIALSSIDEKTYLGLEESMDKNYHFDINGVTPAHSFIEFYGLDTLVYWDGQTYYMSDESQEEALSKVITLLKPVNFDS